MALAEIANLAVRINLEGNALSGIGKLNSAVGGLGKNVGRAGKGVGQIGAGVARAGIVVAGAVVTGLTAAAKAAIDFQDAFAGVRKTVEGTPAELDKLDQSLRNLSTRIPVKFEDLANIAAEAGALGVPTKEVAGFTEVVARLSAATVGLTTDAAAEAFGKLGNVLNLHGKDFERAGSALVALGNAGASSEGDIVEVAKRFGAAGAQAQLSTAQVLGFSSAIASMGVEPEAAGSSLSRLFNNITKYIGTGNAKIDTFAKTAKLSVKGFSKLFAKDASGAVQLFLTNLSKLDRFKAAAVLKQAGIINVRDINAVLLLARGHAELKRQVDLSTKAYKDNTELADVSARRFDTLKARITELRNSLVLAGVTLADGFLPALGRSVEKLQKFLSVSGNQSQLKSIGEDIGKVIDDIDWQQVIDGAKQLVTVLKSALSFAKLLWDGFNALPGDIKASIAGFLVLNKLSGGLVGTGVSNVVGGLAGAAAVGIGRHIPGVGALFAQPVFVTNFPPGFGSGGAGIPGAGGKGLSALSKVFIVGEAIGLGLLVNDVRQGQSDQNTAISQGLKDQTASFLAAQPNQGALENALAGVNQGIHDLEFNPLHVLVQGDALDNLRAMRNDIAGQLAALKNPPTPAPGGDHWDRIHPPKQTGASLVGAAAAAGAVSGVVGDRAFQRFVTPINAETRAAAAKTAGATALAGISTAAAIGAAGGASASAATYAGQTAAAGAISGARSVVSAIYANRPITNVNVAISATSVTKVTTVNNRYGPSAGSRYGDSPGGEGGRP